MNILVKDTLQTDTLVQNMSQAGTHMQDTLRIIVEHSQDSINLISEPNSFWKQNLMTILGVVVGIIITKGFESLSKRSLITEEGEQFVTDVSLLNAPITNQREHIATFLETLTEDSFSSPPVFTHLRILSSQNYNHYNKSHVLKYFRRKIKPKAEATDTVNKLFAISEVVQIQSADLKNIYGNYIQSVKILFEEWQTSFNAIVQFWSSHAIAVEQDNRTVEDDPMLLALQDILENEIEIDETQELYETTAKLQEFVVPFIIEYRKDTRVSDELIQHNRNCLMAFKKIKELRERTAFQFTKLSSGLEDARNKLNSHMERLE